MDILKNKKAN